MADSEIDSLALDDSAVDADACFERGMIYSSGRGVPVDMVEAHKWFNIAAMRGNKDAGQLRREIAAQMADAEIGTAQRAAREWLKANPLAVEPVVEVRVAA